MTPLDGLGLLSMLVWPIVVIGFLTRLARSRRAGGGGWRAFTPPTEESLGQVFFLFALGFLGLALLGFTGDFALPFSRREVLLVTALVALATAYAFRVVWTLVAALAGLSAWWTLEAERWISASGVKPVSLMAGMGLLALLLVALGSLHEARRLEPFALAYALLGLAGAIGLTFLLSSKDGLMELERGTRGALPTASLPLTASLLALAAMLALALAAAAAARALRVLEAVVVALHGVLFAALVFLPAQRLTVAPLAWTPSGPELTRAGVAWAIAFNLLGFFQLMGVMLAGHARRDEALVNLGALFLFVAVVTKYFDWFFAFLDKSVFFIGAGVILLAVGWLLERGRRRLIASLKAPAQ